jgi:hypothetical protein
MTNGDKKIWRESWLSCINELTSLNLQKQSWLDKTNTNPHWSYIEFMSCYFDDCFINHYRYQLENKLVSNQEFEVLKKWHEALYNYKSPNNDDYNCEAILNDREWINILNIGLKAKRKLSNILPEDEKRILNEDIDYLKFV